MKIAVCDDQPSSVQEFGQLLGRYLTDRGFSGEYDFYEDGRRLLGCGKDYDIVFLDIRMGNFSGIDTARAIRRENLRTKIIFLTAYKEYVFQAFDVDASHYLVKPVGEGKLASVLDHVISRLGQEQEVFLTFRSGAATVRIPVSGISYLEVMDRKVYIHAGNGVESYYCRLDDLEKQLPPCFFRCHRSYIVNLKSVVRFDKNGILLSVGDTVPVSKRRYQEFTQEFMRQAREDVRI